MKNNPHPLKKAAPDEVPAAIPTTEQRSRRKLILVVIALTVMGFFIFKLKETETQAAVAATTLVIEKKDDLAAPPRIKKTGTGKKEVEDHARSIRADIRWRKNLVGETVLEGTLTNTSKAMSIKDPVLVVTWLSKSNKQFATTNYPITEVLRAKTTIPYKLKVKAPGKYAAVKVSVESVTVL